MTGNPPSIPAGFELEKTDLLTPQLRQAVYEKLGLMPDKVAAIEAMISQSPARGVGVSALDNVRVSFDSKKNGKHRLIESHTCELAFALTLELDPNVLGYYTQVPCKYVERHGPDGRKVSNPTMDFLVFYGDRIVLVECKYHSWIKKAIKNGNKEWVQTNGSWTHIVYEGWAKSKGLAFRAFVQDTPFSCELRNLEGIYAFVGEEPSEAEARVIRKARRATRKHPLSLGQLRAGVPGFTPRHALWMLARRDAFGMIRSTSPEDAEEFFLFGSKLQAKMADRARYKRIASDLAQPDITEPILTASATDCENADKRLNRLARIEAGQEPHTERMTQLARAIRKGVARGLSPFEVALTHYARSGNRGSRLTDGQIGAIRDVITREWISARIRVIGDLWFALEKECQAKLETTPSETTLREHLSLIDPARLALKSSGMRAYHAARARSDASKRSQPPFGYGHLLVIDSSDFDRRCAENILTMFPAEKPKFYIGIDGATGDTMAQAFIFGPARTDGLALLIRDYVRRHGFLPRVIQVDRGPENTSDWLIEFCKHENISLRHPPTGGSQFNGAAENAIGRVNSQVAHRGPGSTAPDMAGRKTDGKYKSRKTACQTFCEILKEFRTFVFEDMPETPAGDGGTPKEKVDDALEQFGVMGKPTKFDDTFLIKTSTRVEIKGKATEKSGIRTGEGYFTSDELQLALRGEVVDQARRDCADPTVLYAKVGKVWFRAFHSKLLSLAYSDNSERKLFELMYGPSVQREARAKRKEVARGRFKRFDLAREAREASKHVGPAQSNAAQNAPEDFSTSPVEREPIDWEGVSTC